MPKNAPEIPHLDKVAHFGYFFGGGGLLAAFLGLRFPDAPVWRTLALLVLVGAVIGRLDEYHQGFTPGRSGNDNADWLADILGTFAGALVMVFLILPGIWRAKAEEIEKSEIK